jgi:transketolase
MDSVVGHNSGIDRRTLANAVRVLAVDAVEAAKSGHPGMPMGMADIAQVLWSGHLKFNPADPHWANRDRFVLSNGHGSMLQYAVLYLTGYDLPLHELKKFRQLHSKTPGHPELGVTPGVETSTGPLGQGLANSVGLALAERLLAAEFNKPGHTIVDHHTWVFCGDGCLMEGVSHEACSLAGVLGLEKLILVYDDNGISIDGHVEKWFADDTPGRFEAYGWRVIRNVDGHDADAVEAAIREAKTPNGKPTLICTKTTIGWGSPNKAGTHDVHGAALGAAEVAATKEKLGWSTTPFDIPAEVKAAWDGHAEGAANQRAWQDKFDAYAREYPAEAAEFTRRMSGKLPADFAAKADAWVAASENADAVIASRKSSQQAIAALAPMLPEFFGGSADLTGSNYTDWKGCIEVGASGYGNYIHYGVREFGMAAIMNGIALHGGYLPFGGTFLVFSDYMRNALRLAALMRIRVIHVLTHDSIGVGEDGPTHQPVEITASLRLIPGLDVWRPADTLETNVAWRAAVERDDGPSVLIFSRQNLQQHPGIAGRGAAAARGGYVLLDSDGAPDVILIGNGSEVGLAVGAQKILAERGIKARVVSIPCTEVFLRQDQTWQDSVLTHGVKRVAVEAGVSDTWYRFVGLDGAVVGLNRFGESAPADQLFKYFGFTPDAVAEAAVKVLGK